MHIFGVQDHHRSGLRCVDFAPVPIGAVATLYRANRKGIVAVALITDRMPVRDTAQFNKRQSVVAPEVLIAGSGRCHIRQPSCDQGQVL